MTYRSQNSEGRLRVTHGDVFGLRAFDLVVDAGEMDRHEKEYDIAPRLAALVKLELGDRVADVVVSIIHLRLIMLKPAVLAAALIARDAGRPVLAQALEDWAEVDCPRQPGIGDDHRLALRRAGYEGLPQTIIDWRAAREWCRGRGLEDLARAITVWCCDWMQKP